MKELFSNSRHDNEIKRDVAELKNRMDAVEHLLDRAKDVLTLEEAAAFMGMKKSTLYKLTHEQAIPYWKPNGKLIYFEKSELIAWIRQNKMQSKAQISKEAERLIASMEVQACTIHHSLKVGSINYNSFLNYLCGLLSSLRHLYS